jgi:DNA-directed RNA polymerase alpha subunit/DNA-directed RNA polymerase subunit L
MTESDIANTSMFSKLNSTAKTLDFEVKNVDISILNSLRRTVLSDLPNVGFFFDANIHDNPTTNIISNDTPLHNEFIMHRMSLVPICVNEEELENWEDLDYTFTINIKNDTGVLKNVTSGDIQVFDKNDKPLSKQTVSRLFPKDPVSGDHILITKINKSKNSVFEVTAKAILRTPKTNASFGMVSKCSIEFVVDEVKASSELKRLLDGHDESKHARVTQDFNNLNRDKCYSKNEHFEPNHFKVSIDSECSLNPIFIYSNAITVLRNSIRKMKGVNYKVVEQSSLMTIIIPDGSHTVGNLIHANTFNTMIRKNERNIYNINYVGYNIPHPLESTMIFKIKGDDLDSIDDALAVFQEMLSISLDVLNNFENEWIIFSDKYTI